MASRPSKPWRLALPAPGGPVHKPCGSEAAARDAAEAEKSTTSADQIVIQKWSAGVWDEWLRWIRKDQGWEAE